MKKVLLVLIMVGLVVILTACACKHENTEIKDVKNATCTEEGYSGDTYCLDCNKTIQKGESVPALGHTAGEATNVVEPTCIEEGYTGDVFCDTCGILLAEGTRINKVEHTQGERIGFYEPSCSDSGYTGDVFCIVCGELLEQGEEIPKIAHTEGNLINAYAPTCTIEGYSGDVFCSVCGELLIAGEMIPAKGHDLSEPYNIVEATCILKGYAGDRKCKVCGEEIEGNYTERKEHQFSSNECTNCGWKKPGLYVDGKMQFAWDELVNLGYVTVEDGGLVEISDAVPGCLVIDESIEYIKGNGEDWLSNAVYSPFENCGKIEEVYFPCTMNSFGENTVSTFEGCSSLRLIKFFCPETVLHIRRNFFRGCTSMTEFVIPEGVTAIGEYAFADCVSLAKVVIPETMQIIDDRAFYKDEKLSTIELPEGLINIGEMAFAETGIKEMTLPSTIEYMKGQGTVERVDASLCSWREIKDYQFYDDELCEIIFPKTLQSITYGAFSYCHNLKQIDLPEGFTTLKDNSSYYSPFDHCSSLEIIVWPISLIDGEKLSPRFLESLKTIYYRGSEVQWSMVNGSEEFSDIEIIYNYSD